MTGFSSDSESAAHLSLGLGFWTDFVDSFIWSGVPTSELHEKVVNESWDWDWDVDLSLSLSGGDISLDPGISDLVEWIQSVETVGFTNRLFEFNNALIESTLTADGEIGNADIQAQMNGFIRFENEIIGTGRGAIEYGIGLSLRITF